jgi:hypothetical protein
VRYVLPSLLIYFSGKNVSRKTQGIVKFLNLLPRSISIVCVDITAQGLRARRRSLLGEDGEGILQDA